ncbi:hypothetical protein EMCG_09047 [[Emmonsia] crescens]|uniref:Uncharacterized protein n=1 Tax=[Emmonsia] crescens TaxID=73230 RepID=A0A0G2J3H7_9EURO|nr:hypothetical protein EMCG_09047 [Emmonsia crescens UAMH 3008]
MTRAGPRIALACLPLLTAPGLWRCGTCAQTRRCMRHARRRRRHAMQLLNRV